MNIKNSVTRASLIFPEDFQMLFAVKEGKIHPTNRVLAHS